MTENSTYTEIKYQTHYNDNKKEEIRGARWYQSLGWQS